MSRRIVILGASYGSLLGTKLAMAGHDVTLVCRSKTAALINAEGTEVRIQLRGEDDHRAIRSGHLPGRVDACTPAEVDVGAYDIVGLAMQEPQYGAGDIRDLLARVAAARIPCLSIMNMPPLAYLRRIPGLDADALAPSYTAPEVWDGFDPDLVTLCSPDPQAFRPPDEGANVLHVGLPTNFKSACFGDEAANVILEELEADVDAVRLDGKEVPVKLRAFASLFVPLAKWSMLLTGNYRCVTRSGDPRAIRDAVHSDLAKSEAIYGFVDGIAKRLGAHSEDLVPFEKYAAAARQLMKPSSVARAVASGATEIERVDALVRLIGLAIGSENPDVDETVAIVGTRLEENRKLAPAG